MLTYKTLLYERDFKFVIFGTEKNKTRVYRFLDRVMNDSINKKLVSVLNAINTNPMRYSHDQKFKRLEGDVWEIKIKPLRIACIWDPKPTYLVAFYAFSKKTGRWAKHELEGMHRQKTAYQAVRQKILEERKSGRNYQIQ